MRGFQPLHHGRLLELLGASIQLAICSKSPCSIAISSWPYLQDAISSSPPFQLSRKVIRTRSEHSSQSHTLHYVRTHPGTIAERNLISTKLARLCGDSRPHWIQTEKAEIIPSCIFYTLYLLCFLIYYLSICLALTWPPLTRCWIKHGNISSNVAHVCGDLIELFATQWHEWRQAGTRDGY
jgi:hypothetical protein